MSTSRECPHCGGTGRVPDPRNTGDLLRKARERKGLGLREFAERVGCSPAYVCDLEHGRRAFKGPAAHRALSLLKVTAP